MYRRRQPPKGYRSNPWTDELVFFTTFDTTAFCCRSLIQEIPGTSTKPGDQETVYGTKGYPGLNFQDSNGEYVDWEKKAFTLVNSITYIGRWAPQSGASGGIMGTLTQGGAASGSLLYFDAGNALTMTVADTGSFHFTGAGTPGNDADYEYTAGGRFDSTTGTVDVWKDGIKYRSATSTAKPWNTVSTTLLQSGNIPTTNSEINGNIYWVAVFNKALTDPEMVAWTTRDPFDLIWGDEQIMQPVGGPTFDDIAWQQPDYCYEFINV